MRELCESAEYAADFKEHLKIISLAVFLILPLYRSVSAAFSASSSPDFRATDISPTILSSYQPAPSTLALKSTIFSAMLRRTRLLWRLACQAWVELTLVKK